MISERIRGLARRSAFLLALATVIGSCARLSAPREAEIGLATHEGYILTDDGASLFYRTIGVGRDTMVVLHGGPGTSMAVLGNLEPLAGGGTLIFYDQRGGGRSSLPTDASQLTAARFVADLDAVRAHFRLQQLTLLGHSWGALFAGLYSTAHPDRVARLILVAPIAASRATALATRAASARGLSANQQERLRTLLAATDTATSELELCHETQYLRVLSAGHDSTVARRVADRVCGHSPPAAIREGRVRTPAAVFASLGDFDLRADLRRVRAPALVVLGGRDPIPEAVGREWAAALPNARVAVMPRAGHFVFEDDPAGFATLVREFLERLP